MQQGEISAADVNESVEFWKEFDMNAQKASLEKVCIDVQNSKAISVNNRKHLHEKTKAFKALPVADQTNQMMDLLKMYQV
jgi:hypothetical protein